MDVKELGFELAHIGINPAADAAAADTVRLLCALFGFQCRETEGSYFLNEQFEVMKAQGRGRLGHIAIRTADAGAARAYLESMGAEFDESSAMYNDEGRLQVIYMRGDIAGFAFHLAQKK